MRIALCSYVFPPSIGGIEFVSLTLARGLAERGGQVHVLTESMGETDDQQPFAISRRPSLRRTATILRWADVVLHCNVSLPYLLPQLLLGRPGIVVHHTWLSEPGKADSLRARFKRWAISHCRSLAVSEALKADFPSGTATIANPYNDAVFRLAQPPVPRDGDIVFVGRLVTDKGAHVLIDALALLAARGIHPAVSIVGLGPELAHLEAQVRLRQLDKQVRFCGSLGGAALSDLLNRHRVMVVPSIWDEPFGIVALEGIACGCVVVGSNAGGLPEAIGQCGPTVPRNDPATLAETLALLLGEPASCDAYRSHAAQHLRRHTVSAVIDAYWHELHAVTQAPAAPRWRLL
jgi:glycogen synthase